MNLDQDTYRFDAGQAGTRAWPMAPMSLLASELLATLLNHAVSADASLTQLEHVVSTFDYDASDDDCMLCAIGELVNRRFDMPVEGGVLPIKMVDEAYLSADRMRFVIGHDYAVYLRAVATPTPMLCLPVSPAYHQSTIAKVCTHANTR